MQALDLSSSTELAKGISAAVQILQSMPAHMTDVGLQLWEGGVGGKQLESDTRALAEQLGNMTQLRGLRLCRLPSLQSAGVMLAGAVRQLPSLKRITLSASSASDCSIDVLLGSCVSQVTRLDLDVYGPRVEPTPGVHQKAGTSILQQLARCQQLKALNLCGWLVQTAGVQAVGASLAKLSELHHLAVSMGGGCSVSHQDSALAQFAPYVGKLSALTCLRLQSDLVKWQDTDGGKALLQAVTRATGRDAQGMLAPFRTEEYDANCHQLGLRSEAYDA